MESVPSRIDVNSVRRVLRRAGFAEARGISPGFRVWPSVRFPGTYYVEAVRSQSQAEYESTFRAANDRITTYEKALKDVGYAVKRQPRVPVDRLWVKLR